MGIDDRPRAAAIPAGRVELLVPASADLVAPWVVPTYSPMVAVSGVRVKRNSSLRRSLLRAGAAMPTMMPRIQAARNNTIRISLPSNGQH